MKNLEDYLQLVYNFRGDSNYERLNNNSRKVLHSLFEDGFIHKTDLEQAIINETSCDVHNFISRFVDLKDKSNQVVFSTKNTSYTENVDFNNIEAIININRLNNIRFINDHLRSVNKLLPHNGIYIGRAETYFERKLRIFRIHGSLIGQVIWLIDFMITRVIPRIKWLQPIYYFLTGGKTHTVSRPEILGRLVYCGFQILDYEVIDGYTYFATKKVDNPRKGQRPSFFPIVKLPRIGKNGKIISVYKFRTMHPYSEFIQDFMINKYGYNDKGKPNNDWRLTRWGKWMRKLWIDEFPQILNVLKGEMRIIGVRPLSKVRFGEFPNDMQKERIKYKPGCFPPYVALNMPDDMGNIEAERIYLKEKAIKPITTDIKYLSLSLFNILTNKIRSS